MLHTSDSYILFLDQVQTGFGRTGSNFWGFQSHDVVPDIVTMAKGIANGFPMGAVVTSEGKFRLRSLFKELWTPFTSVRSGNTCPSVTVVMLTAGLAPLHENVLQVIFIQTE